MGVITSNAGELTVLETWRAFKSNQMKTLCRVRCYCGKIFETQLETIKRGGTKSCGCYRSGLLYKHGHSGNPSKTYLYKHGHPGYSSTTYKTWQSIKGFCTNKNNPQYPRNGGRGIKLNEEWQGFENFLRDMGEKPAGFRLKRLDKDRGFEPDNCEWVPIKKNRRR
jgi:hypothetical protein